MENEADFSKFSDFIETGANEEPAFDIEKILSIAESFLDKLMRMQQMNKGNAIPQTKHSIIEHRQTQAQQQQPQQQPQQQNINIEQEVNKYIVENNDQLTKSILINNIDPLFNKLLPIAKELAETKGNMTINDVLGLLKIPMAKTIAKNKIIEFIQNMDFGGEKSDKEDNKTNNEMDN